jgi:hypothetical protein
MTYSLYEELDLLYIKGTTEKELKGKLVDLGIYGIFSEIYDDPIYTERRAFVKIVMFIVYCYSYESSKIIIGKDFGKIQADVARELELAEDIALELMELKVQSFATACLRFMNLYEDNVDFVHTQKLKQMYRRIIDQGTTTDADGKSNLDDNFENINRAAKLLDMIAVHEEKMRKKYKLLKTPSEELGKKLASNYRIDSLSVENSLWIKSHK